MLTVSNAFKEAMVAPVRRFEAAATFHLNEDNPEEITEFTHEDKIKTIEIQRVGDNSKFYGFGICQRLNIHLVDLEDAIAPLSNSAINVAMGIKLPTGETEFINYPTFYITEKNREEEAGEISITAYDKLDYAKSLTVGELELEAPYTIKGFISACASLLGLNGVAYERMESTDFSLNLNYEDGANFEGTESIRDALNAAAEATQTIYFIDNLNKLHFKRLKVDGSAVATITEDDYYTLNHGSNRRLVEVAHITELGDNVSSKLEVSGTTQYIRNNPFWEMREDIADIVDYALSVVGNLTINQFDCDWRGNLPLEIGDKINLKKVGFPVVVSPAYVLDDVITFDGGYKHKTQWSYNNSDAETSANVASIGDAINQTFAKVDKVNREITLTASKAEENSSEIAALQLNTDSITGSVSSIEQTVADAVDGINQEIETIKKEVNAKMTDEEVIFTVKKELENGAGKVQTETGYTFDDEGLTISKNTSEISTQITEDGMTVNRNNETLLSATSAGVYAANLHATTYLIIGSTSRFEDFEKDGELRTGCFWLGG